MHICYSVIFVRFILNVSFTKNVVDIKSKSIFTCFTRMSFCTSNHLYLNFLVISNNISQLFQYKILFECLFFYHSTHLKRNKKNYNNMLENVYNIVINFKTSNNLWDSDLSGTMLVDARNEFNKMSRLAILWTVRHR